MDKSKDIKYSLNKTDIIFLFIYYSVISIVGLVLTVIVFCSITSNKPGSEKLLIYTIITSISVSCILCSIRYIKRLYQACISQRIIENDNSIIRLGNIFYFMLRPLFAAVFIFIIIISLLSGITIVTSGLDFVLNARFLYLCVVISSIVGYSIGSVLDKFEKISENKVNKAKE